MPTKLPRINVTVTEEQRSLLFELAELEGGSAAGRVRQMLDAATPLLRAAVPLLRQAAQEHDLKKDEAHALISRTMADLRRDTESQQVELEDLIQSQSEATRRNAASGSERGREEPRSGSARA